MIFKRTFSIIFLLAIFAAMTIVGCGCGDDDDDNDSSPSDDDADDDLNDDSDDDADDDVDDDADDDADDDLAPVDDPLEWVNPFIGTGGWGYGMGALIPGPIRPNSMVKLSPDTSWGGFAYNKIHAGGYYYPENTIRGITHMHMPGIGATDLANINLMPVVGMNDERIKDSGYRSVFSHDNESAAPGYYSVHLDRFDVEVELASTMNAAFHRYTFPDVSETPYVVIDVSYANEIGDCEDADVTVDTAANEVYGYTYQHGGFTGRYGGLPIYFVARFSEDFSDYGTFSNDIRTPQNTFQEGDDIGAYVGFGQGKTSVTAKVGLSIISVEQARLNLDAQISTWDFEATRAESEDVWRDYLSDVLVEGGTAVQRTKFYTALYHLYMLPTSFTEEGNLYVGFDRETHEADDFTYYTDLSLWDTFRTLHPAMILLRPKIGRDLVVSLLKMYEQGGAYPKWAQGLGDTGSMIGSHSDSVIGEAWVKGITDFDLEAAYAGLREHAVEGGQPYGSRDGIDEWTSRGWLSTQHGGAVSRTLEYAYNDFCLAQLADELGEQDDYEMFMERSKNYENLWHPTDKYFWGKDDAGQWEANFSPWLYYDWYTEGNCRHWRWFAPHDVPGLIGLFGGADEFEAELTQFFEFSDPDVVPWLPPFSYFHGNEPDIHAAYLFNYIGRPDKTAYRSRWIMKHRYGLKPDGIQGNDDGGTLSAWYVFAALGFYPVSPCTGDYMIGSPIFTKATVRMGENTLVVTAENSSEENIYVQSAMLNGVALEVPWFHHKDIAPGGTLDFVMGPAPSTWAQGVVY